MVFTHTCWHPPLLNLHSSTSYKTEVWWLYLTVLQILANFRKSPCAVLYSQEIWIINRFGSWSQILGISSNCNNSVKLLEYMQTKEIKHCLTQTVVSIMCQMKSIVTSAAIVARYIVAFVDTTTIKLQVTLINVWETTEKYGAYCERSVLNFKSYTKIQYYKTQHRSQLTNVILV